MIAPPAASRSEISSTAASLEFEVARTRSAPPFNRSSTSSFTTRSALSLFARSIFQLVLVTAVVMKPAAFEYLPWVNYGGIWEYKNVSDVSLVDVMAIYWTINRLCSYAE
jgi:hypothetical protein